MRDQEFVHLLRQRWLIARKTLTSLTNDYAIKNSHLCSIFLRIHLQELLVPGSRYYREKKLRRKRKSHSTMKMAHRRVLHNHFKQMAKLILHITSSIQPIESINLWNQFGHLTLLVEIWASESKNGWSAASQRTLIALFGFCEWSSGYKALWLQ
jgi:hypothetical protein